MAYYLAGESASNIIDWVNYSPGNIAITKLELGLATMCSMLGIALTNVAYYHFHYPMADKLMLIGDSDSFEITIPADFALYETSYSIGCCQEHQSSDVAYDGKYANFLTTRLKPGITHIVQFGMDHAASNIRWVEIDGTSLTGSREWYLGPHGCGITLVYQEKGVSPRIVVEYADSLFSTDLERPSFLPKPNQPPTQPSNQSPVNGATGVSLTPTLKSSAFSDPDSGDTHTASQWQITTTSGDYSSPVFDSGEDDSNKTQITVPSGKLSYDTTYYWRVRHQDNHGNWSEYSTETSFTTVLESTTITISPSSFTIHSGESIDFTATLKDSAGNPLPNKTIQWSTTSGNVNPSSGTTDAQGKLSTTCAAPTVTSQTSVTIMASFAGDAEYLASESESSGTIVPPGVPPGEDGDKPNGGSSEETQFPILIIAIAAGALLVTGLSIILIRRRREVLVESEYAQKYKQWKEEGYDLSKISKKWGKKLK